MRNRKNKNFLNDFDSILNNFFNGITPGGYFGQSNTEEGMDENGKWVKQTYTSDDGSVMMTSFYRESGDGQPKNKLETLKHELIKCIEIDDFEKAIELRDQIKILEDNKQKISDLKNKLKEAISQQDFETAIKLRDELKSFE